MIYESRNWDIRDIKVNELLKGAWERLPTKVKSKIIESNLRISDIPEWDNYIAGLLEQSHIRWNCARFNQDIGIVEISVRECQNIPDLVIIGAFVHEIAYAYQALITPRDFDAIEQAGDLLPVEWGFSMEIEALTAKRDS